MAIISNFSKEYFVEMEVMITKHITTGDWYNVMQATTGESMADYGSRTPGIWFHCKEGKLAIRVDSPVNGNKNYKVQTPHQIFELNKWIMIKVSQTKTGNDYKYKVDVNGEEIHNVTNTDPREFNNVKIYVSSPWSSALPGYIRNLSIKGKMHSLYILYKSIVSKNN